MGTALSPPLGDEPLVTVVTVCLNSDRTIGATLRSVAAQDWPRIEHVVIDGGSRDRTLDIVRSEGAHVARVVSEPDRGIYDAMNKGLAAASGQVIAFLNADDAYSGPGVLRTVVQELRQGSLDAVFGDVEYFRASDPGRVVRRYRSDRFRPDRIAYGWMPAHPALFVRREVFERFGPFDTSYRIAGDFELVARAFGGGKLRWRHIPRVLVRMQAGGASDAGLRSRILLNREVLRACRDNGIPTNMLKLLSRYPLKLMELLAR